MRAIDADAMLARLEEWNTSDSTDKALYNFTLHRILEQPTIEPQRKKGHWIQISPAGIYECSECSKNVMTGDISAYDFCHGCDSGLGSWLRRLFPPAAFWHRQDGQQLRRLRIPCSHAWY